MFACIMTHMSLTHTHVNTCLHAGAIESIPKDFGDQELRDRAKSYRAKKVFCRMPLHIRAFSIRNDPSASDAERDEANLLITSLLKYCRSHWRSYVSTVILKKRSHTFPLQCLSCGDTTKWQRYLTLCTCICMRSACMFEHVHDIYYPSLYTYTQIFWIEGRK